MFDVPPFHTKRMVCLANSRIGVRRCVAGKVLGWNGVPKGWMRPVSNERQQGLSASERHCGRHGEPRLLDILAVPCSYPRPVDHQRENIGLRRWWPGWRRVGSFPWEDLDRLLDHPETLWDLGEASHGGLHNRVTEARLAQLEGSLVLIRPRGLRLEADTGREGKRVRAFFDYRGITYRLPVSDPVMEAAVEETREWPEAVLCVSLGEPYQGYSYKLAAGVLYPGCGRG